MKLVILLIKSGLYGCDCRLGTIRHALTHSFFNLLKVVEISGMSRCSNGISYFQDIERESTATAHPPKATLSKLLTGSTLLDEPSFGVSIRQASINKKENLKSDTAAAHLFRFNDITLLTVSIFRAVTCIFQYGSFGM
ncbi:MAG: hypothetical protein EZS28_002405 [Streblomastix strix]|uniref:Uncharacterized protein n=1 Tax=Streblomastix strix TaxID=222440 RepID=A0A5J4X4B1_9EUKA|nr:MAG: hypothetical protein EZS28_002405 [Streblomastix strix]